MAVTVWSMRSDPVGNANNFLYTMLWFVQGAPIGWAGSLLYTWLWFASPATCYIQGSPLGWANSFIYAWLWLARPAAHYIQGALIGWAYGFLYVVCSDCIKDLAPKYLRRIRCFSFIIWENGLNDEREIRVHEMVVGPSLFPVGPAFKEKILEKGCWFVLTVGLALPQIWWDYAMKFGRWNDSFLENTSFFENCSYLWQMQSFWIMTCLEVPSDENVVSWWLYPIDVDSGDSLGDVASWCRDCILI